MNKEPRYFSVKEFNSIVNGAAHAIVKNRKDMRKIDKPFRKQIMLAVSGVNKCSICLHVHTKSLIKPGLTDDELKTLLEGSFENLEK